MGKNLPYCVTSGNILKYFEKIKQAAVPDKFTYAFLKKTLGFNSGNDQAIVPLLKRMGFIDNSGITLQRYRDFRVASTSKKAIADGIRQAYPELFERNTKAYELSHDEIKEFIKGITELEEGNSIIRLTTKTFLSLVTIANFDETVTITPESKPKPEKEKRNLPIVSPNQSTQGELKFTYTIVLNLPSTTSKEIYDTLFKSLKENLLGS